MRADVIINPRAGLAGGQNLEEKLRKVLFRCDLHFHMPKNHSETNHIINELSDKKCEYLIVCGGDGTLNTTLQPLMKLREQKKNVPALCLIPVGTANDLANQMGVSKKIEKAAYSILNGGVKVVDVLEVSSKGHFAYMLTNGGLGIPAQTAHQANVVRRWLKAKSNSTELHPLMKLVFQKGFELIKKSGSKIYELMLVGQLSSWQHDSWLVELEIPGKTSFQTRAPFVLINNQPSVGGKFTPAPFTSNIDGTFNVMLIQPTKLLPQVRAVLGIRLGRIPDMGSCPSFETEQVKIKAIDSSRKLSFFGDGEILHKNASEITVRCLHPGLPIVTMGEA